VGIRQRRLEAAERALIAAAGTIADDKTFYRFVVKTMRPFYHETWIKAALRRSRKRHRGRA